MSAVSDSLTPSNPAEETATGFAGHDVGSIWDLCLAAEFDQAGLVRGLARWLGPADGLEILDCACGSGFPALDLHRLGYRLTCTDGSASMLARFRGKAQREGVALEPRQVRWQDLARSYPRAFDVVMCRGCSLIYAGTWDTAADPDWSALVSAVENFAACLRPGGRLYVDITPEAELYGEYPQVEEHPPRTVDGHRVQWREVLTADPAARVRTWQTALTIDGESFEIERKSHFLPHGDFTRLLEDVGLHDVSPVEVPGERYAVFSARASA
jgi:SAM-dependent methyltransferase